MPRKTLLAIALGLLPAGLSARLVIGTDDRTVVVDDSIPGKRLGQIVQNGKFRCTAFLVGRSLAMTARHCMVDNQGKRIPGLGYKPEGAKGRPIGIGRVDFAAGTQFYDDWALLRLDQPLGKTRGWFQTYWNSNAIGFNDVVLVQYHAGKLQKASGCRIVVHDGALHPAGTFLHDCDMTGGASGGPLIAKGGKEFYVVAVNVGESSIHFFRGNGTSNKIEVNLAVKPGVYLDTLRAARKAEGTLK